MTEDDISFLHSADGQARLQEYADTKDLSRLAMMLSGKKIPHAPALVTQIQLRKRAQGKFPNAEKMLFTSLGLEQSTSEQGAAYIAERMIQAGVSSIADLTSGLGGNVISFGKEMKVHAYEKDPVTAQCLAHNIVALERAGNVTVACVDVTTIKLPDVDAFFIDPARDREAQSKTRSFFNSSPSLVELLPKMLVITPNICVKLSPACDWREVETLEGDFEREIVEENGTCTLALLWFGKLKTSMKRATIIHNKTIVSYESSHKTPTPEIAEHPLHYLFISSGAITRVQLLPQFAEEHRLSMLHFEGMFLTSNEIMTSPFLEAFTIETWLPFKGHDLEKELKIRNITRASVLARNVPMTSEELRKMLRLAEGEEWKVVVTTCEIGMVAMLCKKL